MAREPEWIDIGAADELKHSAAAAHRQDHPRAVSDGNSARSRTRAITWAVRSARNLDGDYVVCPCITTNFICTGRSLDMRGQGPRSR
jgi:hypothetical protein